MSKLAKIFVADVCIILLYGAAFGCSFWFGVSRDDLLKLIPTATASAIGNILTLSLALNALLKHNPRFSVGNPEQDDWSVIVPVFVDCRGSNDIVLEALEVDGMDFIEVTYENTARQFPVSLLTGEIAELRARFEVVEGSKGEITNRPRLSIACIHRQEGRSKSRVVNQSCPNVFRRR